MPILGIYNIVKLQCLFCSFFSLGATIPQPSAKESPEEPQQTKPEPVTEHIHSFHVGMGHVINDLLKK